MEKPNITKGKWSAAPNGNIYRRNYKELYEFGGKVAGEHPVAFVSKGNPLWDDEFNWQENAQAISALPEMIDALIDARSYISRYATSGYAYERELKESINDALKKAGVEL